MVICALLSIGMLAVPGRAIADGPAGEVNPCASRDICIIITEPGSTPRPGQTGTGGGGGSDGVQMCAWNGKEYPCWDDALGWFSTADGCYYHRSQPQPPAGDPAWGGHDPSSGAVYEVNCRGDDGMLTPKPSTFFAQPPGGPPPDNPVTLGWDAFGKIEFEDPEVHAAPSDTGVVGVPVWLWYVATPRTSGTLEGTAPGRTFSVTARAVLDHVEWDTGDGSYFTCSPKDAATPYRADAPAGAQPPCGHVYRSTSADKKDQRFDVTATLVWKVVVTRSDTSGTVFSFFWKRSNLADPFKTKVAEVQVLN
ncbi:hypothetical protein [Kitasatospora camelliae]|uniref:Peptidase inhibitor family I36 n=1 Tax=Kitasatospora camelliae TaxID=3156397 RepID=A0AAU8K2U6_9ACTN